MTYPLKGSLLTYSEAIQNLLDENLELVGLVKTYYGDQNLIDTTPVACVEPDQKDQSYKGTNMYAQNLSCFILVYTSKVNSPQINRKDSDQISEDIETLIHKNRTLGGIVIDTIVSNITSGIADKKNGLFRASRITCTAKSQTLFPS